jgi:hypothetical protein
LEILERASNLLSLLYVWVKVTSKPSAPRGGTVVLYSTLTRFQKEETLSCGESALPAGGNSGKWTQLCGLAEIYTVG